MPVKTPQNANHDQWRYFISLSYPNEQIAKMRDNKVALEYEPSQEERKLWDVRGLPLIFDHGRLHQAQGKDAFAFGTVRASAFDNAGNLYTFNTFDRDLAHIDDGNNVVSVICSMIDSGKINAVSMRYDVNYATDPVTNEITVSRRKWIENSAVSPGSKPVHESCRIFRSFYDLPSEVQTRLREQVVETTPLDCLRKWGIIDAHMYTDYAAKGYTGRAVVVYSDPVNPILETFNCCFSNSDQTDHDVFGEALDAFRLNASNTSNVATMDVPTRSPGSDDRPVIPVIPVIPVATTLGDVDDIMSRQQQHGLVVQSRLSVKPNTDKGKFFFVGGCIVIT